MAVEIGKFDPLWTAEEWHEFLKHNLNVADYIRLCGLMFKDISLIEQNTKQGNEFNEALENKENLSN